MLDTSTRSLKRYRWLYIEEAARQIAYSVRPIPVVSIRTVNHRVRYPTRRLQDEATKMRLTNGKFVQAYISSMFLHV